MKCLFKMLGMLALFGSVLPSFLYLTGSITLSTVKSVMMVSTMLWFGTCPFWMEHRVDSDPNAQPSGYKAD